MDEYCRRNFFQASLHRGERNSARMTALGNSESGLPLCISQVLCRHAQASNRNGGASGLIQSDSSLLNIAKILRGAFVGQNCGFVRVYGVLVYCEIHCVVIFINKATRRRHFYGCMDSPWLSRLRLGFHLPYQHEFSRIRFHARRQK